MNKLNVKDVIETLGFENITQLGEKIKNRYLKKDALEKYIQEKLSVAHYLNLHEAKNKKLLDIGTGAGWFPYICKLYGHTCIGTDILGRNDYDPAYRFLDIVVIEELVYAQKPIQIQDNFDYVVSLRSFFPNRPTVWELNDWKYFFKNIQTIINDNGGLYLGSNNGIKGRFKKIENASHWGPPKLHEIFLPFLIPPSKELKIKPNTIYIDKLNICKIERKL